MNKEITEHADMYASAISSYINACFDDGIPKDIIKSIFGQCVDSIDKARAIEAVKNKLDNMEYNPDYDQ